MRIKPKLLNGSRILHRWLGLCVVILTAIWMTEAIALPIFFSSGLPAIDNTIPTVAIANNIAMPMEEAIEAFLAQHPDGINSAAEIDSITYFPHLNLYRFQNQARYFDGYINAQSGELLKYGFNTSRFIEQQGFLKWLHPKIGTSIQSSSMLLTLMLVASGLLLFIRPFLNSKR